MLLAIEATACVETTGAIELWIEVSGNAEGALVSISGSLVNDVEMVVVVTEDDDVGEDVKELKTSAGLALSLVLAANQTCTLIKIVQF